ncbi:MAG: threonine synthase [Myxococcota bacterium]
MQLKHLISKTCVKCKTEYPVDRKIMTCPDCGIEGILDFQYDYDYVKQLWQPFIQSYQGEDIFRFSLLYPLDPKGEKPRMQVGPSPLMRASRLEKKLNLSGVFIKDDGRLPSASFKDRASIVAIADALSRKKQLITAASTGNAASSLACLCAAQGLKSVIFVPASAPPAKLSQLLTFGAKVFAVEGTYDDAFELSLQAAEHFNWYTRSTAVNPVLLEGKKSGIFELYYQLAANDFPDHIFVSVGDGCIVGALAKGLIELKELGIINYIPHLHGVQSTGSRVIYQAWKQGREQIEPVAATTRADSISVAFPRDHIKAIRNLKKCGGSFLTVEDEEIFEAGYVLGSNTGIFAEPAAAAAFAGLLKRHGQGEIGSNQKVAVFITGSGLKDVAGAAKAAPVSLSLKIGPRVLSSVAEALSDWI